MAPPVKRSGFDPFITQKPKTTTYDRSNKFDPFIVAGDSLRKMQENERPENAPYLPMSKDATNEAITNSIYGVSGSDVSNLNVGAFKDIPQAESIINQSKKLEQQTKTAKYDPVTMAQNIADKAYGDSTAGDIDWGVASLLYFSKMAENASKPGATGLSSAASAFSQPAAYIMQKDKEKQALEAKKGATVATLVPALVKANQGKTGKMNVIRSGPALDDAGNQKVNDKGDLLFEFIRQDASGNTLDTFEAPKAAGTTVNVGDKDAETFGKKRIGGVFKQFEKFQEASDTALKNRGTVQNLLSMVTNPDFESGWDVNFKTKAREIGKALGFKIDEEALSSAQAFRAASFELVLGSVEQMKGALSDKELDFLKAMNPSLALNKDTNKILLLTMKHTLDKAAGFNSHVRDWEAKNGTMTTVKSYNKMMDEFKAQPINQQNPKDYISSLAAKEEVNLIISKGGQVDDNGDYIPNSLTLEKENEVKNILENKYSLSLLDKTFKNYFNDGQNAYPEYQRKKVKNKGK